MARDSQTYLVNKLFIVFQGTQFEKHLLNDAKS